MSIIEVDLRLRGAQWFRVSPPNGVVSTAKTATNHADHAELWLRADSDCSDPTDPAVLASHPGRLAAIRIDDDEVVLAAVLGDRGPRGGGARRRLRDWSGAVAIGRAPHRQRRLRADARGHRLAPP